MKNLSQVTVDMCLRKLITINPISTNLILYNYGYRERNSKGEPVVHYVLMEHFLTYNCTPAIINKIYKDCEKYTQN